MGFRNAACVLALGAAACSSDPAGPARYSRSGELIALSGGDSGAAGACMNCHGPRGEGDSNLAPRLAGLDSGYLVRQLTFFAEGLRSHPQMRSIAGRMTSSQRLAVARHYAAMPVPPLCGTAIGAGRALYQFGDARRGIPACAGCHGVRGEGNPGNPALAGQTASYVLRQFEAWRLGQRRGDPDATMTAISQRLSPAQASALAAHVHRLPGADDGDRRPREACLRAHRGDPRSGA